MMECDHWWTDYATLHMPEQGPPLEIEVCRLCGVQQRKSISRPDLRAVSSVNLPAENAGNALPPVPARQPRARA